MDKRLYNQMIHTQEQAHMNAYNFITSTWHTPIWKSIPNDIKNILGLHSALGMYNGNLCTQASAIGASEFIKRLNNKRTHENHP